MNWKGDPNGQQTKGAFADPLAGVNPSNLPIVGPIIKGPGHADTAAATAEAERTRRLAAGLEDERQREASLRGVLYQQEQGMRGRQGGALGMLERAAGGATPSAAELQLKRQAGIDAARQYALAAALRGHSPGAALAGAQEGAAQVAGDANSNAAVLRANEMAHARDAYAGAVQGARGQDITRETAEDQYRLGLLGGELGASGQAVQSTLGKTSADIANAQDQTAAYGAGLNALGAGAQIAFRPKTQPTASDKRAKVVSGTRQLADKLGREVKGVTFTYRPGVEDEGKHFGVVAQELERVIPGVVEPGGDGVKRVETNQLTLANTALISELARRLRAVEGHRA